jgi:hypothetical protein
MLPFHEKAKRDTIGLIRGTCAKLPYHRGYMPTYSMENETPFVDYVVGR